ncbi:hypothetical protein EXN66_Car019655 [Channa argus]|uniref:Uncharacterized protein n=1 Tax=Channa argus TaxID=215402 RepID=A0A6G1QNB8_CHAAH|nr:hypothetical protein EXN66_Car019655 [Channa argus]
MQCSSCTNISNSRSFQLSPVIDKSVCDLMVHIGHLVTLLYNSRRNECFYFT